ncbi:MAG: TAXI family TRAP transporter solute-binding subunit [Pirellulaceae bacterium]
MRLSGLPIRTACLLAFTAGMLLTVGCSGNGGNKFITLGTAPIGGAFAPVGNAIASVLNEHSGDNNWKVQAKGTKGSQQNIRDLQSGEMQLGMSNSAISYYAYRGESGWNEKYNIRAVATLAPNIAMFITKKETGINSVADLKGKRVSVGPAGAGFEMFVGPLMTEHGVSYTEDTKDFSPVSQIQSDAVSSLGDGDVDAAFLGGAVPTSSITQACSQMDVVFIPYDPAVKSTLVEKYPFFQEATIAKDKYADLTDDYQGLNVGSMHLITHADIDEETVYQLTKAIWENREEIGKQHPAGKAINEQNAARYTGTPFHKGAIRFYKEIGIWPEDAPEAASVDGN